MPMTNAERQRKYREKLKLNNPEKYKEICQKNLERIRSKYVKVSNLTKNQKALRRMNWRRLKKNQKQKHEDINKDKKQKKSRKLYLHYYYNLKKIVKKQAFKIEKQKKEIAALKKKVYRQKILLHCQKFEDSSAYNEEQIPEPILTPDSKVNSIMQELSNNKEKDRLDKVKKIILENVILNAALAKRYKATKSNKERNILKNIFNTDLIRKYKLRTRLGFCIGLKGRIRFTKKTLIAKRSILAKKIRQFYFQDDVSRFSAGKKETKTQKQIKMQKRYLLDTLINLHKKFKEDTGIQISYVTFIRHKPFHIVTPHIRDRDTCVCKIHANMEFKFIALKNVKIFTSFSNLSDLVEATVCDKRSKECMYSECDLCNKISLDYDKLRKEEIISWMEWSFKKIEYEKGNEIKNSKRVVTERKSDRLENFVCLFVAELKRYMVHVFNIAHQYKTYRNLKDQLEDNEVVLHCDFSENYACKLREEIQAVHFGASQYQISLHTSVVYKKNKRPHSYCTFSDSTNHAPEAIWAHLNPVLMDLKSKYPKVTILHVFSDGPTTQYKQKKNFYLFKKTLSDLEFVKGTWNFSESYHGKGPADGIGGVIKRLLDQKVSHGRDVTDAGTAFALLKDECRVTLFIVNDIHINLIKECNETALNSLIPVPNSQKLHQIQAVNDDTNDIYYRTLTCFCNSSGKRGFCGCLSLKKHCLLMAPKRKKTRRISYSDEEETFILSSNKKFTSKAASGTSKVLQPGCRAANITQVRGVLEQTSNDTDDGFSLQTQNQKSTPLAKLVHTGPQTILHPTKVLSESNTNINRIKPSPDLKKMITESSAPTILSNIRVNYSVDDLSNLLNPKRYNVSSNDLSTTFPELVGFSYFPNTKGEGDPCSSKPKETDIKKVGSVKNFFDLSDSDEN